ncbi:hypothetical protein H0H87_007656 [Tephrocybe sp. NHM501043]|nr:hypothetical protein H0H87_007656 [Tephrocybe sp. NHM501043]
MTWKETLHYPKAVEKLFNHAASLLIASPRGQWNDSRTKRVTVCLDALIALIRTVPHTFPPDINISHLSNALTQLVHSSHDEWISPQSQALALRAKANCALALHRHLTIPIGLQLDGCETQPVEAQMEKLRLLSLETDRALQDVDKLRQTLENNLERFHIHGGIDKASVSIALGAYLDIVNFSSKKLSEWLSCPQKMDEAANTVLCGWSKYLINIGETAQKDLPFENRLSVSYRQIQPLNDGTWSLFALVIMAYLRQTRVYPQLFPLPDYEPSMTSSSLEIWFPFLRLMDKRWILSDAFQRELHPLAAAFEISVSCTETDPDIQDRSLASTYDLRNMLGHAAELPLPELPTMGRPFSLWASVAHATAYGCGSRALFDVVSAFKNFHGCTTTDTTIDVVHRTAIGEALTIVNERLTTKKSTGSMLFAFRFLQKLLAQEREKTSPLSQDNMDLIINVMLRLIFYRRSLISLRECPEMIGTLGERIEMEGGVSEKAIGLHVGSPAMVPLYDLRDLCVLHASRESASVEAPLPASGLQWLEGRSHLEIHDEEKSNICTRIMEGRRVRQQATTHQADLS